MNLLNVLPVLVLTFMFTSAYAVETDAEKNEAAKNELQRDTNKAVNRLDEETCLDTDTECLKKKIKHRAQETKDSVKDKAKEMKDKVDK